MGVAVVAGSFSDAYNSSYALFRLSVTFRLSHRTGKLSKLYIPALDETTESAVIEAKIFG